MDTCEEQTVRPFFSEMALKDLRETFGAYMQELLGYDQLLDQWSSVSALWEQVRRQQLTQDKPQEDEFLQTASMLFEQFQQRLIAIGEDLEQVYQLQNTEVVRLLEECCEEVYQLSNGNGTYVEPLRQHIRDLPRALEESVQARRRSISVVAIVKDESEYIREWVEFHRLAGIDYFYIYDNGSTDGTPELLRPYVDMGIMSVTPFPGTNVMFAAYNDALIKHRNETDYMAYIDADEFLVPLKAGKNIPDAIDEIFENYERLEHKEFHAGGVGINWRVFGTSGHKHKVDGLAMENYLYRAEDSDSYSSHIKTICNPRRVARFSHPHYPIYNPGFVNISERGSVIVGPFFRDAHFDYIQISHYYSKSEEEFLARKRKGRVDAPESMLSEETIAHLLEIVNRCSEVYDPVLLPYAEKIKEQLASLP